jgi:hypothetical protein
VLSAHSTTSIEEVASIGSGVRFFQLYVRFSSRATAFSCFVLFSSSGKEYVSVSKSIQPPPELVCAFRFDAYI